MDSEVERWLVTWELVSPSGYSRLSVGDQAGRTVVALRQASYDGDGWQTETRFPLNREFVAELGAWARVQAERLWRSRGAAPVDRWRRDLSADDGWSLIVSIGYPVDNLIVSETTGEFPCRVELTSEVASVAASLQFPASVTSLDTLADGIMQFELDDSPASE